MLLNLYSYHVKELFRQDSLGNNQNGTLLLNLYFLVLTELIFMAL